MNNFDFEPSPSLISEFVSNSLLTSKDTLKPLRIKALDKAISQIGVSEFPKGSNCGDKVKTYLNSVGLGCGNPWCMAFVYWCYEQICKEELMSNPLFKTGGVILQFNSARNSKKILRFIKFKKNVQIGDIMIMRFGSGTGHTGIVRKIDLKNNRVLCVEGNTNDDGSREGYEVAERWRSLNTIHAFLRVI